MDEKLRLCAADNPDRKTGKLRPGLAVSASANAVVVSRGSEKRIKRFSVFLLQRRETHGNVSDTMSCPHQVF